MNPKLQHQQAQDQTALQQNAESQDASLEFQTAEQAIRHDSSHTELPPAIAERLKKSIEQEPRKPDAPWWKRLFGE